jgi:hypothetical protein
MWLSQLEEGEETYLRYSGTNLGILLYKPSLTFISFELFFMSAIQCEIFF